MIFQVLVFLVPIPLGVDSIFLGCYIEVNRYIGHPLIIMIREKMKIKMIWFILL
jgi:hypothetical protein